MLARLYGIDYSVPEADKNKYQTLKCLQAEALAQEGSFRYLSEYIAYSFAKRSLGSQNASVKMQAKHSLVQNPFEDPTKNFGLPDAEILGP